MKLTKEQISKKAHARTMRLGDRIIKQWGSEKKQHAKRRRLTRRMMRCMAVHFEASELLSAPDALRWARKF
ncbi:hypothetical protein BcepF1.032 [Burkholderia phage BcepF1]|uniref:Uncharacterized protein n=1 Tax=Burkholderia phage BcepF1 TaxID=2886897 RepID=A1YZT6_9CAUD|nr:hypothetical protein BcepF1.032 [Burkholderia phage BcepF1]ABL96763.1 hypothetical protein BcepF1.032 [Burkholderia phage BcepF1]